MAKRADIPFAAIAASALNAAESLLLQWVGGKKSGNEWQADRRQNGGLGDSLTVNLTSGKWIHGSADKEGGDLISFYAYVFNLKNLEAAIEVADQVGFAIPEEIRPAADKTKPRQAKIITPEDVKQVKKSEPSPWVPIYPTPTPADAVAPLAHPTRGLPVMKWEYKNSQGKRIGYIYRFNDSKGEKVAVPLNYCRYGDTEQREWRWMQWSAPNRPLYGLDRLAAKPDAYVVLVEGEKCADAAHEQVQGVAVSWPGGCKAVDKVDLSPLAGRKIYAWADCDAIREPLTAAEKAADVDPDSKPLLPENEQPGTRAMLKIREKLLAIDASTEFHFVDIPPPGDKPSGWDIADAIEAGMTGAALTAFITKTRPHLHLIDAVEKPAKSAHTPNYAGAEQPDEAPSWKKYLLKKNDSIVPCLANIHDILDNDPKWKGVIAYDEFSQRAVKLKPPPYWNDKGTIGEWDQVDDAHTAMWLTKMYRFSPSPAMVSEAIEVVARNTIVNPPKDWLNNLQWDGERRLDSWMLDFMGVELTPYTKRIARWFFMGMVKRVFEPGCQFDYCMVLEGSQGHKKSSAFRIIGGEWFGDTDLDLNSKDSMSAIRGKMLYEFSELGALAKSEATKQKSFLTRRTDEFRAPYGKREIRAARTVIFGGTTNEWEWNKDPTGGRRWWPVEVKMEVDAEGLKEARDQLFAEAVAMVNSGLRYWPTQQEQKALFDPQQLSRAIQEGFVDALYEHVNLATSDFSMFYAATEWLNLDAGKITRDIQTRIGNALRQLGCTKVEKKGNITARFWYRPPPQDSADNQNDMQMEVFDDPIPF